MANFCIKVHRECEAKYGLARSSPKILSGSHIYLKHRERKSVSIITTHRHLTAPRQQPPKCLPRSTKPQSRRMPSFQAFHSQNFRVPLSCSLSHLAGTVDTLWSASAPARYFPQNTSDKPDQIMIDLSVVDNGVLRLKASAFSLKFSAALDLRQ